MPIGNLYLIVRVCWVRDVDYRLEIEKSSITMRSVFTTATGALSIIVNL